MKMIRNLIFLFVITSFISCKKDSFITSSAANVNLSVDTIRFDTLFTTTGSTTHFFKIFNQNDKKLKIDEISLAGGDASFFKINADGVEGPVANDLEIAANDSLYVFVTVTIDQTAQNLPFVVEDSISVSFNGNTRWLQLEAWGQNANFMRSDIIVGDTTWNNDKPFVILGGILIAEGSRLTITQGTKIYLHADAPFVVDGTLLALGDKNEKNKITLQGDRLDEFYRDLPAAWPGIYFRETSSNNILRHVIVKNAYQGIVSDRPALTAEPKVTLQQCIVDNCYDAGILGFNTSIKAENCLISNCGSNIQLLLGGNYEFVHCTDAAITTRYISHWQPVLTVTDFIKQGDQVSTADLQAHFTNCIFWGANGTVENEVAIGMQGNGNFDVSFAGCLWKMAEIPASTNVSGLIENQDPMFKNTDSQNNYFDFRLKEGSPAVNAGINAGIIQDLDGNIRSNVPDIGAYETTF
jgi:hypothetical protein